MSIKFTNVVEERRKSVMEYERSVIDTPPVESDLGKRPMSSGSRLIPACVDAKINTLESEGTVRQASECKPSVPVNLTC